MKFSACVCFAVVFMCTVNGQTSDDERLCRGAPNFAPCNNGDPWDCAENISTCSCNNGKAYCRCNNYVDEFYIGENCNQKWTTLTFALVASLPGFTLALVVGVTVHLIHTFSKPSTGGRNKPMSSSNNTETMFPGIVFASDVKGRPNGLPPRPTSVQGGVTMPSTQPYSIPENTRPVTDRPTAGNLQVPYSSSSSMRPAAGLWDRAAPRPSNSSYETVLPPSPRVRDSFERPPFGVQQPYSYTAGPGQVVSNPYAKNLYLKEERNPLPDPDQSYNPSSLNYSDRHLGHNPDSRPGFPRAQINRMY